jgi:hypothetical protein
MPAVRANDRFTANSAIYPEINGRKISLELSDEEAAAVRGEVIIGYYETPENGGGLISELRTTLR